MSHFTAYCDHYPMFAFNVPALRERFKEQGRMMESSVVRFENRVLDTQAVGYSEEEALLIRQALDRMTISPPLIGVHILYAESRLPASREQGRLQRWKDKITRPPDLEIGG